MIRELFIKLFPKAGIQLIFFRNYGRFADLRNPRDLYEKLIWLNLYAPDERKTRFADKLLVREHLTNLGLGNYLNELYGTYSDPEEINFNSLPSCCMLKCNHGANYNIHIHNFGESDFIKAKAKLKKWLKQDYSLKYGELHYSSINRKILCERYLGHDIQDYKVECINGKPESVMICTNPSQGPVRYYCYSPDWKYMDILNTHHPDPHMEKPAQLSELLDLCSILAEGWPYVRIDTYIHENEIVFGEMTFTPSGFIDSETLPEQKYKMGGKICLPPNK